MSLNLLKIYCRFCFALIIFLTKFSTLVYSSIEWGWRENLNVDVIASGQLIKTINTHDLHHEMYTLEKQISPYVEYQGHKKNIGHPANICTASITVLVQCSPHFLCSVTIPVQNEFNKRIIFCSQKSSKLHDSFPETETIVFSPKESNPENRNLQGFLEYLGHSKLINVEAFAAKKSKGGEILKEEQKIADRSFRKRPSDADSVSEQSSIISSIGFSTHFQHTEQKLVYYLLKNNGYDLRRHIHKALTNIAPSILSDISSYYGNIVGLMLHVHTRLDVCSNCNDSLVLFRKKALDVLNTLPNEEVGSEKASALTSTKDIVQNIPTIEAPVLVTVSSRSRNDTNREIVGYDKYWERDIDHKNHGHINIQLKQEALIRRIDLREDLERIDGIKLINTQLESPIKKESSEESSSIDYTNPSPNCHSIFPDVLQRFIFR